MIDYCLLLIDDFDLLIITEISKIFVTNPNNPASNKLDTNY